MRPALIASQTESRFGIETFRKILEMFVVYLLNEPKKQ